MTTLVNRLVEFSDALRFKDLPAAVVSESKRLLLDSIGCAIAALVSARPHSNIDVTRTARIVVAPRGAGLTPIYQSEVNET